LRAVILAERTQISSSFQGASATPDQLHSLLALDRSDICARTPCRRGLGEARAFLQNEPNFPRHFKADRQRHDRNSGGQPGINKMVANPAYVFGSRQSRSGKNWQRRSLRNEPDLQQNSSSRVMSYSDRPRL
jgi:hypothetical protein